MDCNSTTFKLSFSIVFVWSHYDGANIEQWTIGYGWHQNQEAKQKILGGAMSRSNQQLYNIYIETIIMYLQW